MKASSRVAEGVRKLILDQFAKVWSRARTEQGVVPGPDAVPLKSHPDIATDFGKLKPETQVWITGLVLFGRVELIRAFDDNTKRRFLALGREEWAPADDPEFIDTIAKPFHDTWWQWRRMNAMTGHAGDKPWDEETDAQKANDRSLVPNMAKLLASYAVSDDPDCAELAKYIFGDLV